MATTATTIVGGALFWLTAARFYPVDAVGSAATLLSAIVLLSYFSVLGMGGPLMRQLSTGRRPEVPVGTAVCTVAATGTVIGLGYGLSLPLIAPELPFVHHNPWLLLAFALLTAGAAMNLLTGYVFFASRHRFVVDGLLLTTLKLGLVVGFHWLGSFGLVAASGVAELLAAGLKLVIIRRGLRMKFPWRVHRETLRRLLGFSTAEYLASCLSLAPQLIVALILVVRLDAAAAGAFFVAFQLAAALNPTAVLDRQKPAAFRNPRRPGRRGRRAVAMAALVTAPGAAVLAVTAHWLLGLPSSEYSQHATRALVILAISALPVAFFNWTTLQLRAARQFDALVVINAVLVIAITVLAAAWADRGIGWVAAAWGIGNLLAGGVAGGVLLMVGPDAELRPVELHLVEVSPAEISTAEIGTVELPHVEIPQQESGVNR